MSRLKTFERFLAMLSKGQRVRLNRPDDTYGTIIENSGSDYYRIDWDGDFVPDGLTEWVFGINLTLVNNEDGKGKEQKMKFELGDPVVYQGEDAVVLEAHSEYGYTLKTNKAGTQMSHVFEGDLTERYFRVGEPVVFVEDEDLGKVIGVNVSYEVEWDVSPDNFALSDFFDEDDIKGAAAFPAKNVKANTPTQDADLVWQVIKIAASDKDRSQVLREIRELLS